MLFRRVEHTVFRTPPLSFSIVHVKCQFHCILRKNLLYFYTYGMRFRLLLSAMQCRLYCLKKEKIMEPRQSHIFTDTFLNVYFKAWKGPGNRTRGNYLGAPYNRI